MDPPLPILAAATTSRRTPTTPVRATKTRAPRPTAATTAITTTSRPSTQSKRPRASSAPKAKARPVASPASRSRRAACPPHVQQRLERALTQRLYLVERSDLPPPPSSPEGNQDDPVERPPPSCGLVVMGSTGNIYQVRLAQRPSCTCPDFVRKRDLCKHLLFVLLKVVGVSVQDPLSYQNAYTRDELSQLFQRLAVRTQHVARGGAVVSNPVMANEEVRRTYAQLTRPVDLPRDDETTTAAPLERDETEKDHTVVTAAEPLEVSLSDTRRQALVDDDGHALDCAICYDTMPTTIDAQLTWCQAACGMNFHTDCMQKWLSQQHSSRASTCPNCRQPWVGDITGRSGAGGRRYAGTGPTSTTATARPEGYVNLGALQGQSPTRDTHTYHSRWDQSSARARQRRYDEDDNE